MIDEYTDLEVAKCCLLCKFSYDRQPYEDNSKLYCDKSRLKWCHTYDVCDMYEEGTDIENKWAE